MLRTACPRRAHDARPEWRGASAPPRRSIINHYVASLGEGDTASLAAANRRQGKHKAQVTPISSLNGLGGAGFDEQHGSQRLEIEMKPTVTTGAPEGPPAEPAADSGGVPSI